MHQIGQRRQSPRGAEVSGLVSGFEFGFHWVFAGAATFWPLHIS